MCDATLWFTVSDLLKGKSGANRSQLSGLTALASIESFAIGGTTADESGSRNDAVWQTPIEPTNADGVVAAPSVGGTEVGGEKFINSITRQYVILGDRGVSIDSGEAVWRALNPYAIEVTFGISVVTISSGPAMMGSQDWSELRWRACGHEEIWTLWRRS